MSARHRFVTAASVGVVLLTLAACGTQSGAQQPQTGAQPPGAASPSSTAPSATSSPTGVASGVTTVSQVFGPACSQVPQTGKGSLNGMVDDPVATAASNNPLLTKLVAAVKATNLVDTLNSQPSITVFAPADPAFAALGAKFDELAAKPDQLAPILQYHVLGQRYDRDGLLRLGSVESLNTAGGPLKIEGSGDNVTVNGAKVLCGNIPTKNATVFVIDRVLTPGTNK